MTGDPVAELGRRPRLERAAWRLRHERIKVPETALDAGYDSAEAFPGRFAATTTAHDR